MRRQKSPRKKPLDPIGSAVSPLHLVPSHPSTVTPTGNAGFTSCEYGGTTVESIDPKGKWKKFENPRCPRQPDPRLEVPPRRRPPPLRERIGREE